MRRLLPLVLLACSSDPSPKDRPTLYGGAREVELDVPDGFTEGKQYPLILVLHGYGANGFAQKAVFQTKGILDSNDALVLAPDGTVDSMGKQFWNAGPECCDFDGKNPDDVAYLGGLLDAVMADWPVDPARVYLVGHSNGGYMSYRMACERADIIASIGVLAGLVSSAPACNPAHPVSVLHMHGTADELVPFTEAASSITAWEGHDHCGTTMTAGADLDIESNLAGAETHTSVADGCPSGVGIEEWTIEGGSHIPSFGPTYGRRVFDWLSAHPRVP